MTKKEWEEIRRDYIDYSQEYRFMYHGNIEINLCWSDDDSLPYHVNARILLKKIFFFKKWKEITSQNYATQCDLLQHFKIDGKTLDEIYEQLD